MNAPARRAQLLSKHREPIAAKPVGRGRKKEVVIRAGKGLSDRVTKHGIYSLALPHYYPGMPINTSTSERVLVARCKAGDHSAFMELIRGSSPAALRAIRNIARNPADVDDVMQDTVVNAFNGVRCFDQRSTFSTWLTSIAINNALLLLRRRKSNKEIGFDESGGAPLQVADHRISPEQALIRNQSIEIVRRTIQALPSSLRDYVKQRYMEELPHSEAASSLGISLSAGKSRSLRARRRLKHLLVLRRGRPTLKLHVTKIPTKEPSTLQ